MTEEVKKVSLVNEFGWRIVNGDIEFIKKETNSADDLDITFKSPTAVMVRGFDKVKIGKKFEVAFNLSTQSPSGTLITTFTFVDNKGLPIGKPSFNYLQLSTNPNSVSLKSEGVPVGANQGLLTLLCQGLPPEETLQINSLVVKENI